MGRVLAPIIVTALTRRPGIGMFVCGISSDEDFAKASSNQKHFLLMEISLIFWICKNISFKKIFFKTHKNAPKCFNPKEVAQFN